MTSASHDDFISRLRGDYFKRFDVPLRVGKQEIKAIEDAIASGFSEPLLRAAWNIYLSDSGMHEVGTVGITQFVKHTNRYTSRVKVKPKSGGGLSDYPPGYNTYICSKSFQLCVTPPTFCWGEVGNDWDGRSPLPERHPKLCPWCDGVMWRINCDEYKRRAAQRDVDLMALPEPEPVAAKDLGEMVFPSKPAPVQEALKGFDDDADEIEGTDDFF